MNDLAAIIRERLAGAADAFLCLKNEEGTVLPALITDAGSPDLELVEVGDSRYPLGKILSGLMREYPDKRFAVLVRGCDERALVELSKLEQVDLGRLVMVGVACSADEAAACGCLRPYPSDIALGEKVEAAPGREVIEEVESLTEAVRMEWWKEHFSRCIKCYGCRNICPMCFCKDCALEDPHLVEPGVIPPEFPSFHIIRALDMAGRCIDCGLCEEACPAEIPLRSLYRKMQEIMEDKLEYRAGESVEDMSPLSFLGTEHDIEKLEQEERHGR
jgi:formate dehydrogenase (coenzyme F420) beta subunit